MSQFDEVAKEPRMGDTVKFHGGLLRYEVVRALDASDANTGCGAEGLLANRITTHREEPYERSSILPISKAIWGDLVRHAATVERTVFSA